MSKYMWSSKKRQLQDDKIDIVRGEDDNEGLDDLLENIFKKKKRDNIDVDNNHIYFNDDITFESVRNVCQTIMETEKRLQIMSIKMGIEPPPIYLHLTTNGGSIHAAMTCIDCIQSRKVPVYTIVEGFVASAGTLISIHGKRRLMTPNSYMLIHQLRSELWGKMQDIEDEHLNLKKLHSHIIQMYNTQSKLSKVELGNVLKREIEWNSKECLKHGLVDELYN